jgi:hypothetical protein
MAPPQSIKYLYPEYDYENFEFRSPVNPWKIQTKYVADFEKMKCLEVSLTKGKIIFIPAYWWYSIKYNSDKTSVSSFKYRTYMNNLAISPYIFMHILQLQNIKRDVTKKISLDKLNNKTLNNSESQIETTNNDNDNNNNSKENTIVESNSYPKPNMENENLGTVL